MAKGKEKCEQEAVTFCSALYLLPRSTEFLNYQSANQVKNDYENNAGDYTPCYKLFFDWQEWFVFYLVYFFRDFWFFVHSFTPKL
jgi:hypothetical protein